MTDLTFAIGDIHGRLDLLNRAIDMIADHADGLPHRVICLGDYIDRGPESKGVVERLMRLSATGTWLCLKGNHEDMMVRALRTRDREELDIWLWNGGEETMDSYGNNVPAAHKDWLEALPIYHRDAGRIYVHAGIDPGVSIEDQTERTFLWIRERFLTAKALPCHVVHGHTPRWREKPDAAQPECLPHRTNLDTGAYFTGVLSIGMFANPMTGGPTTVLRVT